VSAQAVYVACTTISCGVEGYMQQAYCSWSRGDGGEQVCVYVCVDESRVACEGQTRGDEGKWSQSKVWARLALLVYASAAENEGGVKRRLRFA
jgi:hypothetical protein